MELKEFVKDILLQIVNAANECNEDFVNNSIDASIENPHGCSMTDFDLAVESVETDKKGGGVSIQVLQVFKAGGELGTGSSNKQTNRVKFQMPLCLPTPKNSKYHSTR